MNPIKTSVVTSKAASEHVADIRMKHQGILEDMSAQQQRIGMNQQAKKVEAFQQNELDAKANKERGEFDLKQKEFAAKQAELELKRMALNTD